MERSTDQKGRHMLQSTTTKDTLMSTSYSSCLSLESVSLDSCLHGLKGKHNPYHFEFKVISQGKGAS